VFQIEAERDPATVEWGREFDFDNSGNVQYRRPLIFGADGFDFFLLTKGDQLESIQRFVADSIDSAKRFIGAK
jgi:hypothetical protein